MIEIKELKIDKEGETLIIDFKVKSESYYENIYIDSIAIDNEDTYLTSGPSTTPLYFEKVEDVKPPGLEEYIGVKSKKLVLDSTELGDAIKNNILFIYITAKGTPAPDTPCGFDNKTSLFSVAYMYPIFHKSICLLDTMNLRCEMPKELIQYILQLKSLELSIKSGNYPMAIKHWKRLKGNTKINTKCNCNG